MRVVFDSVSSLGFIISTYHGAFPTISGGWRSRVVGYQRTVDPYTSVLVSGALIHCFVFTISQSFIVVENCGHAVVKGTGWLGLLSVRCRGVQCLPMLTPSFC